MMNITEKIDSYFVKWLLTEEEIEPAYEIKALLKVPMRFVKLEDGTFAVYEIPHKVALAKLQGHINMNKVVTKVPSRFFYRIKEGE